MVDYGANFDIDNMESIDRKKRGRMTEEKEPELSDAGLELDAIDVSGIAATKSDEPASRPSQEPDPASVKTGSDRKKRLVGPVVAICLLVLITVSAFLFSNQDLQFSLQPEKQGSTSEQYLRVGPISATLPNSDIINLSVDIGCRNDSAKKRLAKKDSLLRNQIVSVLTAPETGKLFEDQRYDEIKARIKNGLEKISEEPVGEVYFAELKIF